MNQTICPMLQLFTEGAKSYQPDAEGLDLPPSIRARIEASANDNKGVDAQIRQGGRL